MSLAEDIYVLRNLTEHPEEVIYETKGKLERLTRILDALEEACKVIQYTERIGTFENGRLDSAQWAHTWLEKWK